MAHDAHDHHHKESFITKYIFTQDHKMIGKQYLVTAIIMGGIGIALSALFRLKLGWPDDKFPLLESILGSDAAPDGLLDSNWYLGLVTLHGTIMVFFVLTGGLSGTFSNLLIPLQIGARDMASGLLNMIAYWLFFISSSLMAASLFIETGPAMAGWTVYPPLSVLEEFQPGSGLGMTLWLLSMAVFIASSLIGGINYIVTILNLRTKGMTMTRLPLTIWAFFITAILGVLSFPVLLSCAVLLLMDRGFGTSFYMSDIVTSSGALDATGGSPILYEHLFWFLGHPEVYIILLPALGITSEVISTLSRKPIFGYRAMIGSMLAIGFLSFIVWGHHMFMTGMNPFLGGVFTFTTLLIAIPSAVKVFNYITTIWKGNVIMTPAMLFSIGSVSTFISGGITGIILADSALDISQHDTYFVVGHFHIVMGMTAILAMFAGVYHWFPKLYGKMMNLRMGMVHFWFTIVCGYGVFIPMHFLGEGGMPRRYYENTNFPMFDHFLDLNVLISIFATIGVIAQVIFFFNFIYSSFRGPKASQNPWNANSLEWTTPVEHIHGNWYGELPVVYRWPYDYSKPGKENDFVPQNVPLDADEEEH
ncbi:MAG: cbb3-type cytochrome c oxidase subunit I [Flavobacteriales bacterium]|nr:cbb3-type cytochrome c oxidase subunit I [Flavobacteriales bacterium]